MITEAMKIFLILWYRKRKQIEKSYDHSLGVMLALSVGTTTPTWQLNEHWSIYTIDQSEHLLAFWSFLTILIALIIPMIYKSGLP